MELKSLSTSASKELLQEVIPFWFKHGVDNQNGGFICGLSHTGNVVDASKYSWYQGRGAWIFAKIYERTKNQEHLDIARKALDFVKNHCIHTDTKNNQETTFYTIVGRDGAQLKERSTFDKVGYASMFYAEGMQQVAIHETIETRTEMLVTVQQLLSNFLSNCNNKLRNAPEPAYLLSKPYQKGTRTLGHQMIPLRLATQVLTNHAKILTEKQSMFFETVAKEMVHNITVHFFDKDTRLTREELTYDFTPLNDPVLYYLGHAIEAYWFVMAEGCRLQNRTLVELACDRIQKHIECAWDPVFGGLNRGMSLCNNGKSSGSNNVSPLEINDKQLMDKVAWVEQEGLVALLMVRERSERKEMQEWATIWYEKLHIWVHQHFPLKKYGYDLWLVGGDRKATFEENYTFGNAGLKSRKENYHHPRYLMCVVEEYERKMKQKKEDDKNDDEDDGQKKEKSPTLLIFMLFVMVLSVIYDLLFKVAAGSEGSESVEDISTYVGEL